MNLRDFVAFYIKLKQIINLNQFWPVYWAVDQYIECFDEMFEAFKRLDEGCTEILQAMLDLLATLDRVETRWESRLKETAIYNFLYRLHLTTSERKPSSPWNVFG